MNVQIAIIEELISVGGLNLEIDLGPTVCVYTCMQLCDTSTIQDKFAMGYHVKVLHTKIALLKFLRFSRAEFQQSTFIYFF